MSVVAGLILFVALAALIAGLLNKLDEQYCMTDCCDPTSYDPSTNGLCWDCQGTGHAHGFVKNNGRVR